LQINFIPIAIVLAASAAAQTTPPTSEPMGKIELVNQLSYGAASSGLAKEIEQRGINFELDQSFLQVLSDAGAKDELVNALKTAKPVPGTPIPAERAAEIAARETNTIQHLVCAFQLNPNWIHFREAEPEYRAAVQADPSNPFTHFTLGSVLSRLGRHFDAAAEFREALHLRPDWIKAHLSVAKELQSQKMLDEAILEIKEAIRLDPDSAQPHYALAGALKMRGDEEGSAEQRRIAETIMPTGHPGGHLEMAKLIYQSQPKYPAEAKKKHIEGAVRLTIIVGKDGAVKDWEVENGDPLLASATVEAVRQWRYTPCTINNVPEDVLSEVTLNFQIH
jgi:TonB family protein